MSIHCDQTASAARRCLQLCQVYLHMTGCACSCKKCLRPIMQKTVSFTCVQCILFFIMAFLAFFLVFCLYCSLYLSHSLGRNRINATTYRKIRTGKIYCLSFLGRIFFPRKRKHICVSLPSQITHGKNICKYTDMHQHKKYTTKIYVKKFIVNKTQDSH